MTLTDWPKMFVSDHGGWDFLGTVRPPAMKLFAYLVVPLSLLAALMIVYAGNRYGPLLFGTVSPSEWKLSAVVFFFAELITVPVMAWAIRDVAEKRGAKPTYNDAFLIATVAPIPLWLASLSLFVAEPLLIGLTTAAAMLASISLIYHGVNNILRVDDHVESTSITFVTIFLGITAWTALMVLVFLPTLIR